jgi:hypothetical protein
MGYEQIRDDAESEASYKAARQASRRMADEMTPTLVSTSREIGRALNKFKRAGLLVECLDFNTTTAFLQARMQIATPNRSPATASPPWPADIDLGLRLHESLVNEAAQEDLKGRSFPLQEVNQFFDDVTRGYLLDGRTDEKAKTERKQFQKTLALLAGKTTIILTEKDPVTVDFANQEIGVVIQVASISAQDGDYEGMRVVARYKLENSKDGVHAARKGPIQFLPPTQSGSSDKKLKEQSAAFLFAREIVFDEVLKERFTLAPVSMPAGMSGLRFQTPRAGAGNGWFGLAWNLAPGVVLSPEPSDGGKVESE